MSIDSANRSFGEIVGVALLLGAAVLCGALGGVLAPLIAQRLSHGGPAALLKVGCSLAAALLFGAAVATSLVLGARALVTQARAGRRLARRVRELSAPLPEQLAQAADLEGLTGRVVYVQTPRSFSFVYGALTPRVAVSQGLLDRVADDELRAVLAHERYHVTNLDPLKTTIINTLTTALFFLPALDTLSTRYLAGRELAADRRAVTACGRDPLARALLKIARGPAWVGLDTAPGIGGPDLLKVRVTQLETGTPPPTHAASASSLLASAAGAGLLVAVFLTSLSGFGGATAVRDATGTGLASAVLLDGLTCAAPFTVAGVLAYMLVLRRAHRPCIARHHPDNRPTTAAA
jgi:Zn-dependent protease with chaperone function